MTQTTPMMAQWHSCKEAAKEALLLFQMGDFYEAFYEDAVLIAKELDLSLTKRQEVPMAGIPLHTCENYIDKLVSKGYRIAIAEQVEDPAQAKGLVKREVVKIVTPGTVVNSSLISENTNNFIASVTQTGALFGLAFIDLTTGEFKSTEFENENDLLNELYRLRPAEIITTEKFKQKHYPKLNELKHSYKFLLSILDEWKYEHQLTLQTLLSHFKVQNLDGFGLKEKIVAINAAGALLTYLRDTLLHKVSHITELTSYSTSQFMVLDCMSQRNLELTESLNGNGRKNTLLEVLDKTKTAMGSRLLRHWVKQPLLDLAAIQNRHEAVETLVKQQEMTDLLRALLEGVRDIERLIMKVCSSYASPRDLITLSQSFRCMPEIKALLRNMKAPLLQEIDEHLSPLKEMTALIDEALVEDPPLRIGDGQSFREGIHPELDELRKLSKDSKAWIACYQAHLREQLGIKTLKVGFNRAFGYFIEVSKGQTEKMPPAFQRRQTLVNAERYISPELKSYENKVLNAEEKIQGIENELFAQLKQNVSAFTPQVMKIAHRTAELDCLASFAETARTHDYVRPLVDDSNVIDIVDGRHPVIEKSGNAERFIPNDTQLNTHDSRMFIITGPNMAGKSTYIRQVALITIMAQVGSFVPARQARIGLIDKVFTRIGASDDLSRGQSTFMVEMTETANILHHATDRSLVILDEIGRGTSTYDGISIAWAVAEYLLTAEGKRAKTLFATHYWELTKLEGRIQGAVNYNVAVQEHEDHIIFLHKIIRGGTDKSYGIHVARLAGMPTWVLTRSKEILAHLEENANRKSAFEPKQPKKAPPKRDRKKENENQMLLFQTVSEL